VFCGRCFCVVKSPSSLTCATQDGESIRCAVYGCYVRMHPLCGLVENCYSGVAQPKRPDAQGRMLSVPFLLCPYHSTAVQTG
jgi:hypothetical protein